MTAILITGVGGPLGQAIVKAARMSELPCRIVGTDRHELSAGFAWVDAAFVMPDCGNAGPYLEEMRRICAAEKPRLIIPGSEGELKLLSEHARELFKQTGAIVVASSPEILCVTLDKWETSRFLKNAGLNYPDSALFGQQDEVRRLVRKHGFPLIAKQRHGSGSKGLCIVRSWKEIDRLGELGCPMLLQEYLEPDDQEYTISSYTLKNGRQVGSISLRRELAAGNTYRAWVSRNEAVQREAMAVVKAVRPFGPCNIQLRLTPRGPVTFEINPRFSGTVAMRSHFGYREVEMAIRDLVLGQETPVPEIREGMAMRYWEELYLDGDEKAPAPGKAGTDRQGIAGNPAPVS